MKSYTAGAIVFGILFGGFTISLICSFNELKFPTAIPGLVLMLGCGIGMVINIVKGKRTSKGSHHGSSDLSTNTLQSALVQPSFVCSEKVLKILFNDRVPAYYTEQTVKTAVQIYEANAVRIISDCERILDTTNNAETFFSRYKLLCDTIHTCSEIIGEAPFFTQIKPNSYKVELVSRKADMIDEFIARSYAEATQSGLGNATARYFSDIKHYENEMLPQNLNYLRSLENYDNAVSRPNQNSNIQQKLQQIDEEAKIKSERYYEYHISQYNNLNFENVKPILGNNFPLNSVEKHFLKALAYQEVDKLAFPEYWTFEYNINYKETITKFIENGYVIISQNIDDFSIFKVDQLKIILRALSLPVAGQKQELIDRLTHNEKTKEALNTLEFYNKRFVLTDIGRHEISHLPKSMTKDYEFEDKCINFIIEEDFNAAYIEICRWRSKKFDPWNSSNRLADEIKRGLPPKQLEFFNDFWNSNIEWHIPKEYTKEIKACLIFGNMMSSSSKGITNTLFRRNPGLTDNKELYDELNKNNSTLSEKAKNMRA